MPQVNIAARRDEWISTHNRTFRTITEMDAANLSTAASDAVRLLNTDGYVPAHLLPTIRTCQSQIPPQIYRAPFTESVSTVIPATSGQPIKVTDFSVRNGHYEVRYRHSAEGEYNSHFSYLIHTVVNGPLANQRVMKIRDESGPGGWRAFGFITTSGHLRVWERYIEEALFEYMAAAQFLLASERSRTIGNAMIPSPTVLQGQIQRSATYYRCIVCNSSCSDANYRGVCTAHSRVRHFQAPSPTPEPQPMTSHQASEQELRTVTFRFPTEVPETPSPDLSRMMSTIMMSRVNRSEIL